MIALKYLHLYHDNSNIAVYIVTVLIIIIIIIIIWDFDIRTDHLISARKPDLIIINNKKENLQNFRLCCPE